MKFLSFAEKDIDSFLMMQCTDLARSLTKQKELEVAYNYVAYYAPQANTLYMSRFWDPFPAEKKLLGLKSDLYVHGIGFAQETNYTALQTYYNTSLAFAYPLFAQQLLALMEELRLYDRCIAKRAGTKRAIQFRKKAYRTYYQEQLKRHIEQRQWAETLLCTIYLHLTSEGNFHVNVPEWPTELSSIGESIINDLYQIYDASTTTDVANLCLKQWPKLETVLIKDIEIQYFIYPTVLEKAVGWTEEFADMTRQAELKNDDLLEQDTSNEEETHQEQLPTWHRETSQPTQSFLQFELESGTKMKLLGDAAREMDSGDQALGSVQASSRSSRGKDYTEEELISWQEQAQGAEAGNGSDFAPYGTANRHAVLLTKELRQPTASEITQYRRLAEWITPWKKRLQNTIEKTLEHKQQAPHQDLQIGRLGRKLLHLWTEEHPRLFYKKQQPSEQVDACFALLVDCSSSMLNKMEQTKKGIVLFHETLASLKIRHSVHGFWEDALKATNTYQPNYLHEVISFERSLSPASGYSIMQLSPQEDNRDGFMIRHMTEAIKKRTEKHKVLLVFSDGEPAAADYDDDGILDTYQAVLEARKNGLTVIGVFLSTEEIQEQERKAMQNIYGKHHLLVNDVEELPDHIAPLLKQLILKQIK